MQPVWRTEAGPGESFWREYPCQDPAASGTPRPSLLDVKLHVSCDAAVMQAITSATSAGSLVSLPLCSWACVSCKYSPWQ